METVNSRHSGKHASVVCLALALAFITFPKAGMMEPASLVFSLLIVTALCFYLNTNFGRLDKGDCTREYTPWLVVLLVITGWICLQLFLLPRLLGWQLFFSAPIPAIEIDPQPANRLESMHYWALFCSYWAVAFLTSRFSFSQIKVLLWVLLTVFIFQIVFGLTTRSFPANTSVLGIFDKVHYIGSATGTFVNHNHFAGFLAVCWPIVLSFLLLNHKEGGIRIPEIIRWVPLLVVSWFCLMALYFSGSRMAIASSLFGFSLWLWIVAGKRWDLSLRQKLVVLTISLVILFLIAAWVGLAPGLIFSYLGVFSGELAEGRPMVWLNTLNFPLPAWLWGAGAGAFSEINRVYHIPRYALTMVEAHNDYLQFVIEFGIIGSSLVLAAVIYWLIKSWPKHFSLLRLGGGCGVAAICLHSLVDFNLQIPATAAYFWFAVGCMLNPNLKVKKQIKHKKRVKIRKRHRVAAEENHSL